MVPDRPRRPTPPARPAIAWSHHLPSSRAAPTPPTPSPRVSPDLAGTAGGSSASRAPGGSTGRRVHRVPPPHPRRILDSGSAHRGRRPAHPAPAPPSSPRMRRHVVTRGDALWVVMPLSLERAGAPRMRRAAGEMSRATRHTRTPAPPQTFSAHPGAAMRPSSSPIRPTARKGGGGSDVERAARASEATTSPWPGRGVPRLAPRASPRGPKCPEPRHRRPRAPPARYRDETSPSASPTRALRSPRRHAVVRR